MNVGFPVKIKEDALVSCGRHCCLCHKFCGLKIEIHHIKPKASGGPDTFENAIPLCFDCHADMRTYDVKHPKGTKYSESELIRFRNNWYSKVKNSGGFSVSNPPPETDKIIFNKLTSTLPWNGSLSFISENNFAGFSFRTDFLNELTDFLYLCDNPIFEFLDADLESLKSGLRSGINIFINLIGQNTFPTHNVGFNHIPPEWEIDNLEHFNTVVNDIHSAAEDICQCYQNLIRMGRQKLGVIPAMP